MSRGYFRGGGLFLEHGEFQFFYDFTSGLGRVIFSNSNGGAHELPVLWVVVFGAFWLVEFLVEFFVRLGVCVRPPPPFL